MISEPDVYFRGASVCVTGAGGSIGSEICAQLLRCGVKRLVLVSLTESGLYNVLQRLRPIAKDAELVAVLGSVTDFSLMKEATKGCKAVIHTAAHKHVPLCEQNPIEAVRNNVGGTVAVAAAASASDVPVFILVSSDKAVNPSSVMGRTKRAAELAIRYAMPYGNTDYITVRFGNVLDSAGSVLPLWRKQLQEHKQITLTDPNCERYFMSIPEAVRLTLCAATLREGLYVLDMGQPRKMGELAADLVRLYRPDVQPPETVFNVTGLRPGEKLKEELHHGGLVTPTEYDKVMAVMDEGTDRTHFRRGLDRLLTLADERSPETAACLKGLVR